MSAPWMYCECSLHMCCSYCVHARICCLLLGRPLLSIVRKDNFPATASGIFLEQISAHPPELWYSYQDRGPRQRKHTRVPHHIRSHLECICYCMLPSALFIEHIITIYRTCAIYILVLLQPLQEMLHNKSCSSSIFTVSEFSSFFEFLPCSIACHC